MLRIALLFLLGWFFAAVAGCFTYCLIKHLYITRQRAKYRASIPLIAALPAERSKTWTDLQPNKTP